MTSTEGTGSSEPISSLYFTSIGGFTLATRLTKAQKAAAKKKRDREVMFWGIAGCVLLIGFAVGWGKFAPLGPDESSDTNSSYTEEVSDVNDLTDMQIDDILDAVSDRCDQIADGQYVIDLDELRDILEMVLKEGAG